MDNSPTASPPVPQRIVRPLDFLPEARKHMLRTKDLKIGARGDIAALRELLTQHPECLNQPGSHSRTLLWEAVRRGKLPAVEWLVEKGADVNAVGRYNGESFVLLSPFCAAVYYRRPALGRYLREHGAREDIFRAAFLGDLEAVTRELVHQPELVSAEDPQDRLYYVPLLSFGVASGNTELLELLLERGALVAPYSLQLLSLAAKAGRQDLLELLLARGARILPLGAYYFRNVFSLEILRFFLERGASPSRARESSFSPLVYLSRADKGEQPQKIRLLLEYGAPVDEPGPKGRTALHYASAAGFTQVLEVLLEHGAHVAIRDQLGETALALARRCRRPEAVKLLIAHGAPE